MLMLYLNMDIQYLLKYSVFGKKIQFGQTPEEFTILQVEVNYTT